jgi:hypothetical protein
MTMAMEIRLGRGRHPRMGGDPIGSRLMEWRYIALQRNAIPFDGTGSVMSPNPLAVAYT